MVALRVHDLDTESSAVGAGPDPGIRMTSRTCFYRKPTSASEGHHG